MAAGQTALSAFEGDARKSNMGGRTTEINATGQACAVAGQAAQASLQAAAALVGATSAVVKTVASAGVDTVSGAVDGAKHVVGDAKRKASKAGSMLSEMSRRAPDRQNTTGTVLATDEDRANGLSPGGIGKERRTLHQTSQWIVHLAPCVISAPTGGLDAKHLLKCITSVRLCGEPRSLRHHGESSAASFVVGGESRPASPMAVRSASGSVSDLEGAPLPLLTSPHTLNAELAQSLLKKLVMQRYQPGDVLFEGNSHEEHVSFVIHGTVSCHVNTSTAAPAGNERVSAVMIDDDDHSNLLHTAGEPFVSGSYLQDDTGAVTLAPPAGAPFGEWLLLTPSLRHVPRVVAATPVSVVTLDEDALTAAMQADDQLAHNLWWARAQRETYTFLRRFEPFCRWNASKVWRWLSMGKHIKVPEGKGQLGVTCPFVVLLQGKCHVMVQEDDVRSAGPDVIEERRKRMQSVRLLGSGANFAAVMNSSKNVSPAKSSAALWSGNPSDPQRGVGNPHPHTADKGRWVGSTDVIYQHDEIAYHFARDSLVFIPGPNSLPWLPANLAFGAANPSAAASNREANLPSERVAMSERIAGGPAAGEATDPNPLAA